MDDVYGYELTTINEYNPDFFTLRDYENNQTFVTIGNNSSLLNLDRIVGVVKKVSLTSSNNLFVDFKVLQTPMGKLFVELWNADVTMELRPIGIGYYSDGKISNYNLSNFEIGMVNKCQW